MFFVTKLDEIVKKRPFRTCFGDFSRRLRQPRQVERIIISERPLAVRNEIQYQSGFCDTGRSQVTSNYENGAADVINLELVSAAFLMLGKN